MEMKRGERALVTVPARLAEGQAGAPAGCDLRFEVTMHEFVREKESWDLKNDEEKLARGFFCFCLCPRAFLLPLIMPACLSACFFVSLWPFPTCA